ncbi:MAG: hypothetical protein EU530_04230 [Promethearchaeota archaeon]|nr:MAG: hypothetical protein EU530_04230 [Candidatus Lokiarchaeota archaeon]
MQYRKITTFFGLLSGITIAIFGVFFFNFANFLTYDGRSLVDLFIEIKENTFVGLYEFSWIGFRFNLFNFFYVMPIIEDKGLFILEAFLPVFFAWFISGLITGLLVIGSKRGLLFSFIVISSLVILWLCFAVISGANITFVFIGNIFETGGGILTALLSVLIGGAIGGGISSAISIKIENKKIIKDVTRNGKN